MRFQSDAQDSDSEFTDYGTLTQAEYDLLSQEIDKLERSAAAQGTALLLAVNYAMSGTIYWLDRSEIRVGRVAGNDIIIPNVQASRTHAIIATRDRVSIRDAKSLNGTFVNGDRIDQEIDLQHEDKAGLARQEAQAEDMAPITQVVCQDWP
jgi:pSer/pThr/pTyr-binding forkhead associated (FHA) protein